MFLSRIQFDTKSKDILKYLSYASKIHGIVESCFPKIYKKNDARRHLWRIDYLNGKLFLLMVSPEKPEFPDHLNVIGCFAAETKNYDSFLQHLATGQQWHFRLTANPTIKVSTVQNPKGKIFNECTREQQLSWLLARCVKHGFLTDGENCVIKNVHWIKFTKREGNYVRFQAVTFEGILTISDVALFRGLLIGGIGREKAYGMGLLTVAQRIQ